MTTPFVASKTEGDTGGSNATAVGATAPTMQDRDLLVAAVTINGNKSISTPSGWTLLDSTTSTSILQQNSYYKPIFNAAGEPGSYSWGITGGLGAPGIVQILNVRGADLNNPIGDHSTQANASSTSIGAAQVSPSQINNLLLGFFGTPLGGITFTPASGMTSEEDNNPLPSQSAESQALSSSGPTGTRTATASSAAVSIGQLIAINPLPIFPGHQPSQRWDDSPNLWQEYQAYSEVPYAQWYLPQKPATHQLSQQLYADLPNYWQEYEAYARVPFAPWYVPDKPSTHQPSQQLYADLPDYTDGLVHWSPRQKPFSQWFVPPRPSTFQPSQRIESLPVFDSWWEQFRHWPTPTPSLPQPPPVRQENQQLYFDLPNYWQEWEAYIETSYVQWYVPVKPPTHQLSQRWDAAIDPTVIWFEQRYDWPIPVSFVPAPTPPPTHQLSQQLYFDSPDYSLLWFEQFRLQPTYSNYFTSQEGTFSIYNQIIMASQVGVYRIQNNIAGYNIYVSPGDPADPTTESPTLFTLTLPVSIPLASGGIPGTRHTYQILVRRQDHYGLESQNWKSTTIIIDYQGNLILPDLLPPQGLGLILQAGDKIRVLANYPGFGKDQYPATQWKVWAGTTPPNPSVDTPVVIVNVTSKVLMTSIGPYSPGLIYVVVGLFRATDSKLSPTITGTITVPQPPTEVVAVPSGHDIEP